MALRMRRQDQTDQTLIELIVHGWYECFTGRMVLQEAYFQGAPCWRGVEPLEEPDIMRGMVTWLYRDNRGVWQITVSPPRKSGWPDEMINLCANIAGNTNVSERVHSLPWLEREWVAYNPTAAERGGNVWATYTSNTGSSLEFKSVKVASQFSRSHEYDRYGHNTSGHDVDEEEEERRSTYDGRRPSSHPHQLSRTASAVYSETVNQEAANKVRYSPYEIWDTSSQIHGFRASFSTYRLPWRCEARGRQHQQELDVRGGGRGGGGVVGQGGERPSVFKWFPPELQEGGAAGRGDASRRTERLPLPTDGDGNCLLHASSLAMWGFHCRAREPVEFGSVQREPMRVILYNHMKDEQNRDDFLRRYAIEQQAANSRLPEDFRVDTNDWENLNNEFNVLLESAREVDQYLSAGHVFSLSQALRRPIVVYEDQPELPDIESGWSMGGIYLPLRWDAADVCKTPLSLLYTGRGAAGHFTALVSVEPPPRPAHDQGGGHGHRPGSSGGGKYGGWEQQELQDEQPLLPLNNHTTGDLLPVRFLRGDEGGANAALEKYLHLVENPWRGAVTEIRPVLLARCESTWLLPEARQMRDKDEMQRRVGHESSISKREDREGETSFEEQQQIERAILLSMEEA